MAVLTYLLAVLVIGLTYLYWSFKRSYRLWHTLNVPYLEPTFPFGNFQAVLKNRHLIYITRDIYEQLKGKRDYAGVYMFKSPVLFVTSPDFAKDILVRHFVSFIDRGVYSNRKDDPLSGNIFFLEGEEWKALRNKLTPAFTSGKMKTMFHTIAAVAEELADYIGGKGLVGSEVDVKDLMGRFTTDVISSCVFGLDGKSIKDGNSDFMQVGSRVMKLSKVRHFLVFLAMLMRDTARQLGFRIFDQESTEFFTNMVHETIALRRENNYHRNDLMQAMIEHLKLVEDDKAEDKLTIDEVAANSFLFYFAGFETSSTTLTVALYHLARNQDIQEKAREEVKRILLKYENKFTYEGLTEMTYLEQVLQESLRIFPPIGTLHRISNTNYTLANGAVVPIGTFVIVPIYAMHHDADIYPEPEKFDPERFTEENKSKRHPYSFLPFGEGPRICIGARFAMMQTKIALANLLSNYRIKTCDQTISGLEVDDSSFTLVPKEKVVLKIEKL